MKTLRIKQISKFFHKRSLELILLAIIILVINSSSIKGLFNQLNLFRPKQIPISSTQPTPSPTPGCTDEELMISDMEDYLKNNGLILNLLRENCEIILGSSYLDVTGDSKPEILLNTSFSGCASCHERVVRVIDGLENRVIFEMSGDGLGIEKSTFPINGIQITGPLRRNDEALCCPSEGLVRVYVYNNTAEENDFFYLYDTRSIKFKNDEQFATPKPSTCPIVSEQAGSEITQLKAEVENKNKEIQQLKDSIKILQTNVQTMQANSFYWQQQAAFCNINYQPRL